MTEQDKMKAVINTFLRTSDTDQAILLNGRWGCGKTYFIDEFRDELINSNRQTVFYYSLNGFDDIKEVVRFLQLQIITSCSDGKKNSNFLSKIIKTFNKGLSKLSSGNQNIALYATDTVIASSLDFFSQQSFNTQKSNSPIFILDDLERISEKLEVTDFLGRIHSRFVVNGIKVIYVADESKIQSDKYNQEKEKYISRTIAFKRDNDVSYRSLLKVNRLNEDFIKILHFVFPDTQDNLRTVLFCMDLYNELQAKYDELNLSYDYDSPEKLFYSICVIGKFYKDGHQDKSKLLDSSKGYFLETYINKECDDNVYSNFVKKIRSNTIYYCYIENCIVDFIYDGYLDSEELKEFLRKPVQDEGQNALDDLLNIDNLETSELQTVLGVVRNNLDNEQYTIRQLGLLEQSFMVYAEKLEICTMNEALSLMEKSIFSNKEENRIALQHQFEYWLHDPYSVIKNPTNKVEEKILLQFNQYKNKNAMDDTDQFYRKLLNLDTSILVRDIQYRDIFTRLVEQKYLECILNMNNKSINLFSTYISMSTSNLVNANEWYKNEIPALNTIKQGIEEKFADLESFDFLKEKALKSLKQSVNLAIQHIEN